MFLFFALPDFFPERFPRVLNLGNHMGNPNQVIVIFHRLIIPAEQMLQRKAVIFLGVKALIFNLPASASEKGRFRRVSMAQGLIRQKHKRIWLAVLRVFQTAELMTLIVDSVDEIISIGYLPVFSLSGMAFQFAQGFIFLKNAGNTAFLITDNIRPMILLTSLKEGFTGI